MKEENINKEPEDVKTQETKETAEEKGVEAEATEEKCAEEKVTEEKVLDTPAKFTRLVAEGVVDPKKAEPNKVKNTEDNLELHNMSKKERRRAKRQKMKDEMENMTRNERISYLIDVYKWTAIVTAAIVIFVGLAGFEYYKNSRPIVLSYAVVNSPNAFVLHTDIIDKDYKSFYNFKKSDQIVQTPNIAFDLDTYEEKYNTQDISFTTFPTLCYDDYYDIVITDKKGAEYLAHMSLTNKIESCMQQDMLNRLQKTCPERLTNLKDANGEEAVFALDISDTVFAKKLDLGYTDVYLCFPGTNDQNITNVRRITNFILDLDLECQ